MAKFGVNFERLISQGSVAACLRFDGTFIDYLIANFFESVPVKE